MTRFLLSLPLLCALAAPVYAQQNVDGADPLTGLLGQDTAPDPTLEDVRLSLQQLDGLLTELRQQLVSTGQVDPGVPFDTTTLERLNAMETRIRALTGEVERLQFDVQRMAEDGGRRVSDLEFRLSEIEGGDGSFVAPTTPLGGGVTDPGAQGGGAAPVAVSEQAAFDRALTLAQNGDLAGAQTGFETFLETFPGGPLAADARYGLGRVMAAQGRYREAAMNFLNAYSAEPNGENSHDALASLANALGQIGQVTEACLTYDEALARFSSQGDDYVSGIVEARTALGCT